MDVTTESVELFHEFSASSIPSSPTESIDISESNRIVFGAIQPPALEFQSGYFSQSQRRKRPGSTPGTPARLRHDPRPRQRSICETPVYVVPDPPKSDNKPRPSYKKTSQLQDEVLALFVAILEEETSPLSPSSMPSTYERRPLILPPKSLSMRRGRPISITGVVIEGSKVRSKTANFHSMPWPQQRRLLDRELRRLLKWNSGFKETQELGVIETSFSRIGKTLMNLVQTNSQFADRFSRLMVLLARAVDGETLRFESQRDPLKTIETAVDNLFDLIHLDRKRMGEQQPSQPTHNLDALGPRPTKILMQSKASSDVSMEEDVRLVNPISPKLIHDERKVRFLFADDEDSINDDGETSHKRSKAKQMDEDFEKSDIAYAEKEYKSDNKDELAKKNSKLIIKISDHADAFHTHKDASHSEPSTPDSESIFRTLKRSTTLSRFDFDDVNDLSLNFELLNLGTTFSSSAITNKLLSVAHFERPVLDATSAETAHPKSQHPLPLQRLDKLLALMSSLPTWKIYTTPGYEPQAKSATSMIYLSLFEEFMSCAIDFSKSLGSSHISKRYQVVQRTDIDFFCAGVDQLSELKHRMKLSIGTAEDKLHQVLPKLKGLSISLHEDSCKSQNDSSDNDTPPSPICRNCITELQNDAEVTNPKNDIRATFAKVRPLFLACYLLNSTNGNAEGATNQARADEPENLIPLSITDLYKTSADGEVIEDMQAE